MNLTDETLDWLEADLRWPSSIQKLDEKFDNVAQLYYNTKARMKRLEKIMQGLNAEVARRHG